MALKRGGGWIWEKLGGEDQTPPPPARETTTYLGIPPAGSKPLPPPLPPRKVSEAPAEAASRPGGLMAEAAPGCPSPPLSGSARHRSGGNCGRGCPCLALCSPPPLPARSVRPLLCQGGPLPLCRSLPSPLLHSRNTSPSVAPFHHIRIGEASNSWPAAPRLGAGPAGCTLPRSALSGSGGQRHRVERGSSLLPRLLGKGTSGLVLAGPRAPPPPPPPRITPSPLPQPLTLPNPAPEQPKFWKCLKRNRNLQGRQC